MHYIVTHKGGESERNNIYNKHKQNVIRFLKPLIFPKIHYLNTIVMLRHCMSRSYTMYVCNGSVTDICY